jgi:hypothetical protein
MIDPQDKTRYIEEHHWCAFSVWGYGYCSDPPKDWALERMIEIDDTIDAWVENNWMGNPWE